MDVTGGNTRPNSQPAEQQDRRPGLQVEMRQQPKSVNPDHKGSGKLDGKIALITGGDSGIGRAVAVAFAKEGADIAITFLEEHEDAKETQRLVEAEGRKYVGWAGDLGDEKFSQELVAKVIHVDGGSIVNS